VKSKKVKLIEAENRKVEDLGYTGKRVNTCNYKMKNFRRTKVNMHGVFEICQDNGFMHSHHTTL
jgi:hypothetical protein